MVGRLRRLILNWRGPSAGSAMFTLLLAAMTVLSLIAALQLRQSYVERKRTTDVSMKEFASLAARLFGDRAFGDFESLRLRAVASVVGLRITPHAPMPSLAEFARRAGAELDAMRFAVGDPNRGFFSFDRRSGAYRGLGAAASPGIGDTITRAIASRPIPVDARQEPFGWVLVDRGEPVTVGYAALHATTGEEVGYFGFTYTRRHGWKQVGDAVMRELPLLPGSLVDPNFRYGLEPARTDTLVAIRLYDASDRVLYDSRPPFVSSVEGEFVFRTGPGGFRTVASLHPGLAARVRQHLVGAGQGALIFHYRNADGEQRFEIPLVALLPIVALLLAIAAGMNLWRERAVTRARRDFVASVSHELRTPLAQIRMFTETLQLKREKDDEERAHWLNIVSREARRLGDLVENILLFSHIDADRAKIEKERTDLGELIEEIVEGYVPIATGRGMRIVADAPSRIFAMVDPRAMRQIVVNLLDNALKYGPPGQTVTIELERVGAMARLMVTDQGPGIAPEDRSRMWRAFVRLGRGVGTTGGSGIGLNVVRNLVMLHDASIRVEDAPRGGARFTVEFPISESAEGLPLRATGEFRAAVRRGGAVPDAGDGAGGSPSARHSE